MDEGRCCKTIFGENLNFPKIKKSQKQFVLIPERPQNYKTMLIWKKYYTLKLLIAIKQLIFVGPKNVL